MKLSKRQKEYLEDLLWEQYKELNSLINANCISVDKKYCSNNKKVVINILDKLQEEK